MSEHDQNIILFGSQRTGSTWVYEVLKSYLESKRPTTQFLWELFAVDLLNYPYQKSGAGPQTCLPRDTQLPTEATHAWVENWSFLQGRITLGEVRYKGSNLSQVELKTISAERLTWLSQIQDPFLLKVFPGNFRFNEQLCDSLCGGGRIVCLERKNKRNQILSAVLAEHSGIWSTTSQPTPLSPPESKFNVEKKHVSWIGDVIKDYYLFKVRMPVAFTLYYEDILEFSTPFELLNQFGFSDWSNYRLRQPVVFRQHPEEDYLKYFSNPEAVSDWVSEVIEDIKEI